MNRLPPLLSYYGSKYNMAPKYPRPRYRRIVEPFAGSAAYSMLHAERDVLLVDKYDKLIAVWQYLIAVSPAEILAIPLLGHDETVDDLGVCQEARWLVGWWSNLASSSPKRKLSKWSAAHQDKANCWGVKSRSRIAATVPHIRHWRAICCDYREIDIAEEATWFVDPPYQVQGAYYRHSSKAIDFDVLGSWCRSLKGQVMVCENEGATWLPFEPFTRGESSAGKRSGKKSLEVLWTNDGWRMPQPLSLPLHGTEGA